MRHLITPLSPFSSFFSTRKVSSRHRLSQSPVRPRRHFAAMILATLLMPFPLSVCSLPGQASARTPGRAPGSGPLETEEIVVTAARYPEGISTVSSQVTVITRDEIEDSTARTVPDLLRTVASVHVSDIAGNRRHYTVDLRGFGETAALNTLVLVDGDRINQSDLSGTDWMLIPLERVERIEILHGAGGSVLYGDQASGGVIHIITREAEGLEGKAGLTAGSFDTYSGEITAGGAWSSLSLSLSARRLFSDGYRENSSTDATDMGLNLAWYPADPVRIRLSGRFHRDDSDLPGAIKKSEFAAGTTRRQSVNPDDFAEVDDYAFQGGVELSFRGDNLFTLDGSYRKRDVSSFATFAGGNFTGDTTIDTVAISPRALFRHRLGSLSNDLTVGFDFQTAEEGITNRSLFFGEVTTGSFELTKDSYGFFAQEEAVLKDRLSLSGGYRYDKAEFSFSPGTPPDRSMEEHLYTGGVNYLYRDRSYGYISYSKGFRYPVLDELFNFFTNTIDGGLKAQGTDDVEGGVRHYLGARTYVHLNLFWTETEDEIFFNPSTYGNENLDGKAERRGVEFTFELAVSRRLSLSGSYTYCDSEISGGRYDGGEVPNVPDHKADLRAVAEPGMGFTLILEGIHVGRRPYVSDFGNEFPEQKSYTVLNAEIRHRWDRLVTYLAVGNVGGAEYAEYGVLGGTPLEEASFPSPGRTFTAGASLGF